MSETNQTSRGWTRLVRPASTSVHRFSPVPELFVTVHRLDGSDLQNLPRYAEGIVAEVSRLEKAEGGRGVVHVLDGSREENDLLVLRLLPCLADAGARARLDRIAERLNQSVCAARARHEADYEAKIEAGEEMLGHIETVTCGVPAGEK